MDSSVERILSEYESRYQHEFEIVLPNLKAEEVVRERDRLLMSIGPEAGDFLHSLIKSAHATRILELGTSFGHSTVYLADAARHNNGVVITCDLDPAKQAFAKEMLMRAGLIDYVEFMTGDAVDVVSALQTNVDFCLIDLWNAVYIRAFDALYPKLDDLAYVVADNMIVPDPAAGKRYRRHIRQYEKIESVLLPIGWGLELSRKVE